MPLTLYAHPFSSYCQKALVALYEHRLGFTYRKLDEPGVMAELAKLWPLKKFPVLVADGRCFIEASIIIERVDAIDDDAPPLIPRDPSRALDVRFLDRFFDNYVHAYLQAIVADALRAPDRRDPQGVEEAHASLDTSLDWLDVHMASREWADGQTFSMADCAAAPALFYLDWVHRIGDRWPHVQAYRSRLNARPSFARCIEEARPYRHLFPLGAPDRD